MISFTAREKATVAAHSPASDASPHTAEIREATVADLR
jgi:hypothetical protein